MKVCQSFTPLISENDHENPAGIGSDSLQCKQDVAMNKEWSRKRMPVVESRIPVHTHSFSTLW